MQSPGNTRAGKLLHKLVFFLNSPKTPVFGGHRWVAFTRERWADKTGLTIDQVKRNPDAPAGERTDHPRTAQHYGKVPNFIRLSQSASIALCVALAAQKCATQVTQTAPPY